MAEAPAETKPDTIVLIHGFWVTPRVGSTGRSITRRRAIRSSHLRPRVRGRGRGAPRRPHADRAAPGAGDHRHARELDQEIDRPPIIIGHSAGGVFTQILLDHGFGAVGVAIDSAPTEGVKVIPLSEIKSGFPILKNPANRHRAVGFTPKQWHYVFANTFSEEKSLELYERYHIPASGRVFWGSALANIHPGRDDTYVDYHNDARPPLLFIS